MERGVVGLAPINPKVPTQVNQFIKEKKQKIIDGTFKIFQGPLKDQQGKTVLPEGEHFKDKELLSMKFFVEGVDGIIKK